MTVAYVVRCNFNDPTREAAWNEWYSGPKLKFMMDKPQFISVQRFHRVAGEGRNYVAFWTLVSPAAFETPQYKSDWGFFEWGPFIIDWSRDLFARIDGQDVLCPRLGDGGFLRLVSFEGATPENAERARAEVDRVRPGTTWMKIIGLDQHTPVLGYSIESSAAVGKPVAGAFEAIYRPISPPVITDDVEEAKLA
jgi:hypothetical protein